MRCYVFCNLLTQSVLKNLIDHTLAHPDHSDIDFINSPEALQNCDRSRYDFVHNLIKGIWLTEIPGAAGEDALCSQHANWIIRQAKRRVGQAPDAPIQGAKQAAALLEQLRRYTIVAGRSLNPFQWVQPSDQAEQPVATLLRYCFGDPTLSLKEVVSQLPYRLIVSRGQACLDAPAHRLFQRTFDALHEQLIADRGIHPQLATITLDNILALWSYFSIPNAAQIQLPLFDGHQWKRVSYRVEKLQLSPDDYPFSPYYAYGLLPLEPEAAARLLFMGTTFPTGCGSFFTYLADLHPVSSVGSWAFRQGQGKISDFLQRAQAATGLKSQLIGQSLGGSLALHSAVEFSDSIEKVSAFVPTALHEEDLVEWNRKVEAGELMPQVEIFRQEKDLVSMIGKQWGKGWNIHYIRGLASSNGFEAHIRVGSSGDRVLVARVDEPVHPSRLRKLLRVIQAVVGAIFFTLGMLILTIKRAASRLLRSVCRSSHSAPIAPLPILQPLPRAVD